MSDVTLTEFLLARIAEDEAEITDVEARYPSDEQMPWARRQRAECEVKRRIVAEHQLDAWEDDWRDHVGWCLTCEKDRNGTEGSFPGDVSLPEPWPCPTLRALAAVYADHPDYFEEWKP